MQLRPRSMFPNYSPQNQRQNCSFSSVFDFKNTSFFPSSVSKLFLIMSFFLLFLVCTIPFRGQLDRNFRLALPLISTIHTNTNLYEWDWRTSVTLYHRHNSSYLWSYKCVRASSTHALDRSMYSTHGDHREIITLSRAHTVNTLHNIQTACTCACKDHIYGKPTGQKQDNDRKSGNRIFDGQNRTAVFWVKKRKKYGKNVTVGISGGLSTLIDIENRPFTSRIQNCLFHYLL